MTFDAFEKEVIRQIVQGKDFSRNALNILNNCGMLANVSLSIESGQLLIHTATIEQDDLDLAQEVGRKVFLTLTLLSWLESEGLIVTYQPGKQIRK
ncbi:hypothetical protein [Pseudovibrio sp. WM33]|uniref:hypothetical protein n=1 Tax=Pseudovibrio sp. WM33 TaxID=1735585 RepID=UPI0007AE99F4|nr:hypothetical protein [Pseudovibrio sp. WM33]KZL24535.1 hypothetical protein PsWM33_02524 [Pseudovibrio sp. WM33]